MVPLPKYYHREIYVHQVDIKMYKDLSALDITASFLLVLQY